MAAKILVISSTPTHPQDAGNRARIYSFVKNLQSLNFEVYFLHIKEMLGDEDAMRECWGEHFFTLPYTKPKSAFKKKYKRLDQKIFRKIEAIVGNDPLFTYKIDDWYDDLIEPSLKNISAKINPDIVIVEYVFFSKVLECFDNSVLKIIDTHDKFADRYRLYLRNRQYPRWFSTTKQEELRGLKRADVVIAIQDKEKEYFQKLLRDTRVVTVGHLLNLDIELTKEPGHNILFVGSSNPINVQGIEHFINEVFPPIKDKLPEAKLYLAGTICEEVADFSGCIKLGEVEKLETAYALADLVINPVLFGTGLKIKSIEALGYAKPLVTTSIGAEGIEDGANQAFLVANSADEFIQAIARVFTNIELRRSLTNHASEFAKNWNQKCLTSLIESLNSDR
jgi:polysaccharide biosynthesis protein PslH